MCRRIGVRDQETQEQRTERFMRRSLLVGVIVGTVAGLLYAMSELNPNKGQILSLETTLIFVSGPCICLFIGWMLSRL
jgi:type III secretory pathway component EscS